MKRFVVVFLLAMLVASLLPVAVIAAPPTADCQGGYCSSGGGYGWSSGVNYGSTDYDVVVGRASAGYKAAVRGANSYAKCVGGTCVGGPTRAGSIYRAIIRVKR